MTVKEKLLSEYRCAILAVLGDLADQDEVEVEIEAGDLNAINHKVKFYLDIEE